MTPLEAHLTMKVEALRQENKLLREKIDLLVRRVFGASSEKLDTDQLLLSLEGAEVKKPEASSGALAALEAEPENNVKPTRKGKKKGGITEELLDSLPAVDVVLVPDEVQAEPEAYRLVDEVITQQLDYEPGRYVCRNIRRQRYARIDLPHLPPVIAPLPTLLERSKAGPGMMASILTAKYCDHLPLYRQQQIAKWRHGIELSRQDMSRWVGLAAEWLRPIYQIILGGVLDGEYAQVDETVTNISSLVVVERSTATFGRSNDPGVTPPSTGPPHVRRRSWRRSSRLTSVASSSATATAPTRPLPSGMGNPFG